MRTCRLRQQRSLAILYFVVGAVLFTVHFGMDEGDFRSGILGGMGAGLFACGIVLLVRTTLILRDAQKAEEYHAAMTDERMVYLAQRARSMAWFFGLWMELIVSLVAIFILQEKQLGIILSDLICIQMLLYSALFWWYSKKY